MPNHRAAPPAENRRSARASNWLAIKPDVANDSILAESARRPLLYDLTAPLDRKPFVLSGTGTTDIQFAQARSRDLG
jgi:hypothetical protein